MKGLPARGRCTAAASPLKRACLVDTALTTAASFMPIEAEGIAEPCRLCEGPGKQAGRQQAGGVLQAFSR